MQEAERAAGKDEDAKDYPQELSGEREVRAERSVDNRVKCATRCHESEKNADQATDRRACVGNELRVESKILRNGPDQNGVGAYQVDRVQSQSEQMQAIETL